MGTKPLLWILSIVAASVAGATIGAAPALAGVTVSPGEVTQGGAAKLTFHVTEDRAPAYTTKIELRLPEAAPVAETYPMTVPDWAPQATMRKITAPLGGIHHGQTTEVVAAITWTRVGKPASAGAAADLTVSLGPMPTVDTMAFTVIQTYSDGSVTNWSQPPSADNPKPEHPAPVLTLLLPPAAAPPAPAGGDTDAQGAGNTDDEQVFGPVSVGLAAGLIGGLGLAGWFIARGRRPATAPDAPAPAPASAASANSAPASPAEPEADAVPGSSPSAWSRWRLRE